MKNHRKTIDRALGAIVLLIAVAVPFVVAGVAHTNRAQVGIIDTLARDSLDENGQIREEAILYTLVRLEDGSLLRIDGWFGALDEKVLVAKTLTGLGVYIEHTD